MFSNDIRKSDCPRRRSTCICIWLYCPACVLFCLNEIGRQVLWGEVALHGTAVELFPAQASTSSDEQRCCLTPVGALGTKPIILIYLHLRIHLDFKAGEMLFGQEFCHFDPKWSRQKTEHSSIFWVMKMIIEWWETDVYCLQLLVKFRQIISLDSLGSEFISKHLLLLLFHVLHAQVRMQIMQIMQIMQGFSWFLVVSPGFPSLNGISTVFPLSVTDVSTRFRSGPPMQPPKLTEGCDSPGSRRWLKNPGDRCDVQFGGTLCMRCVPCWFGRKQITCSVYVHVENTKLFNCNIPRFIHYLKSVPPSMFFLSDLCVRLEPKDFRTCNV